ncbi:zinc ribbon domain-containing protein [Microbacterium radiodurans]|uniref:DNA-binding protein n=1 Tax=Microbacterium radiodurans TaxID=661398 RepID=A0A5J5ISN1_9MICO|nr:C4-type zinc ribbon domain-containing protein [Microbacterium radiodurans]KAA9087071.1 DNA-binding protein [Microbacterium radiodurans]
MNATPADQLLLLDLVRLDAQARGAEAAKRNPAQAARVKELLAQRQELSVELTRLLGLRDDVQAELGRIVSDIGVVDARAARDEQRLSATSSAKDAQGLEHEIASLARRKSELEDGQLAAMERLEDLETQVRAQEALVAEVNAEGGRLSAEGKAAVADADAKLDAATRDRAAVAARIPGELLARYETLAQRTPGAGLLQRRTCGGCHMELAGSDLKAIGQAAADEVVTCPECGCILVRTDESGL